MLDLYKLRIFVTVVQEGSFSAAAERLYITQSAVSQHVSDLEAGLGVRLFTRGRRGVTLTHPGQILLGYARQIFDLVVEAENAVADVENLEGGALTIGATPGVGVYLLPDWISSFRARYPRLTISTQTGITSEIISGILAQRVDLGVIEGELEDKRASRLVIKVLQRVEQFVVVGWRHPWWDRESAPLTALADQTFIMRPRNHQSRIWLDQVLEAHGITPQIGTEFDNLESIKRAAASGTCLTILPEYVFKQEEMLGMLRRVRIEGAPLQREIKLISARDAAASPVTRAFTRHLEAEFAGAAPA